MAADKNPNIAVVDPAYTEMRRQTAISDKRLAGALQIALNTPGRAGRRKLRQFLCLCAKLGI